MSAPSAPASAAGHGRGVVFQTAQVTSVDGDIAYVQTQLTQKIPIRTDIMRAKGIKPKVGETWLLEKVFDFWVFSILLVAVEGSMIMPIANVDGLADALNDIANDIDTNSAAIAANTAAIATNTSGIAANTSALATYGLWERYFDHERAAYGDAVSSIPRIFAFNLQSPPLTRLQYWRTRMSRDYTATQLKIWCQGITSGSGTTTLALFTSSTFGGPYTRVGSDNTLLMGTTGLKTATFPAVNLTRGIYVAFAYLALVYAGGPPGIAATDFLNTNLGLISPLSTAHVWGMKTSASMPTTLDLADGTWSVNNNPWWIALT